MAEELEQRAAVEAERLLDATSMLETLDRVVKVMEKTGVTYLFLGGLASAALGRYRHTADIDLLVQPSHARDVLAAFDDAGFATEETFPHWLFKARWDGDVVDLLFRSEGDIFLDPEMLEHSLVVDFEGRDLPVVGPEDLIVMKALAHQEATPRHWFDAMGIIGRCEIDWEYLIERSRRGPWRVLSLLAYAQSSDLAVPSSVMRRLFALVDPQESDE